MPVSTLEILPPRAIHTLFPKDFHLFYIYLAEFLEYHSHFLAKPDRFFLTHLVASVPYYPGLLSKSVPIDYLVYQHSQERNDLKKPSAYLHKTCTELPSLLKTGVYPVDPLERS